MLGLNSVSADEPRLLERLPTLARLEALDLQLSDIGDGDVSHIAVQPRLTSLNLAYTDVTGAGLAQLASLKSLEELAVDDRAVSIAALESLRALVHLKALHIKSFARQALWALDEGDKDADRWRRAFDALRQAIPGIVIDAGPAHTKSFAPQGLR